MNKVILHGRLARDVDLRTTASGKSVAQVNITLFILNLRIYCRLLYILLVSDTLAV